MPAVSKKQQRFFGYLLSNPDERKKRGISKKAAKDFAQDIQEVSPPGWGHTKAEKEKTKPWKPKSKIGGSAAAFKRDLDSGKFKGLPGDKTKKEKTASMFKIMWAAKKKGYKPHYKPGTNEKYKKYQEEERLPLGQYKDPIHYALVTDKKVAKMLNTDEKKKKYQSEGLGMGMAATAGFNAIGNIAKAYGARQAAKGAIIGGALSGGGAVVGGALNYAASRNKNKKSDSKKKKVKEDWKPEIEHSKLGDAVKKKREKKRKEAEKSLPPHLRLDVMKKAFSHTNESTMPNVDPQDRKVIKDRAKTLFKKDLKGEVRGVNEGASKDYEELKRKIGSKEKHSKPVKIKTSLNTSSEDEFVDHIIGESTELKGYQRFMADIQAAKDRQKNKEEDRKKKDAQYMDTKTKGVKFYDKKGSGRIVKGKKVYN